MKLPALILAIACALTVVAAPVEETFQNAQSAYDAGNYVDAIALYDSLISQGVSNSEVHYNLANAYFKNSNLPEAVWHYRKAWYTAPRDPDIRANLHFALNAAGAIDPSPTVVQHFFESLSLNEWILAATVGYIVLTLFLILALLIKPARPFFLKLGALPLLLILMAAAGIKNHNRMVHSPEFVVVKSNATALFGPIEGSMEHYKIPLGALVQQRSTNPKGWVEIQYDNKIGWIRNDYIRTLSP